MVRQSKSVDNVDMSARERNRAKRKARLLAKHGARDEFKSTNG